MQVLFQSVERSMKSWISKDVLDIHGMGRTRAFKLLDALMKAQQEDYGASA